MTNSSDLQLLLEHGPWIPCDKVEPQIGDYLILTKWYDGGVGVVHVEDFFKPITAGLSSAGQQLYEKYYKSAGITHWTFIDSHELYHAALMRERERVAELETQNEDSQDFKNEHGYSERITHATDAVTGQRVEIAIETTESEEAQ